MKILYKPKHKLPANVATNAGTRLLEFTVSAAAAETDPVGASAVGGANEYIINTRNMMDSLKSMIARLNADIEAPRAKTYVIHLSDKLVKLNRGDLENILWSVLKQFVSWKHDANTTIIVSHDDAKPNSEIVEIINVATKIQHARMLAMLPANLGYPQAMAKHLKSIFAPAKCSCKILTHKTLERMGFNLLLSVGNSAKHKPAMVVVESKKRRRQHAGAPTVCIVGKGITFDSGGLNIKTHNNMDDMKFDKIGAIYGAYALLHLMETRQDCNFVGVFPFAENAVSQYSTRPGDVVKSYSGKTVEILDTDAEGRLILADALYYACERYSPDIIVDIATLTGFSQIISCWHSAYFYAESEKIRNATEKISFDIGERMVPMMTWTDTKSILKSNVADLISIPRERCNDSYAAALFLRQFVKPECEWLHIDLAHEHDKHIPEGNGIRTIIHVLENYLKK